MCRITFGLAGIHFEDSEFCPHLIIDWNTNSINPQPKLPRHVREGTRAPSEYSLPPQLTGRTTDATPATHQHLTSPTQPGSLRFKQSSFSPRRFGPNPAQKRVRFADIAEMIPSATSSAHIANETTSDSSNDSFMDLPMAVADRAVVFPQPDTYALQQPTAQFEEGPQAKDEASDTDESAVDTGPVETCSDTRPQGKATASILAPGKSVTHVLGKSRHGEKAGSANVKKDLSVRDRGEKTHEMQEKSGFSPRESSKGHLMSGQTS